MITPQLERLHEHCHRLRLYQIENELTARLEQAAKKEVSYADFLDELLAARNAPKNISELPRSLMKTSISIAAPQTTSSGPKCLSGGIGSPNTPPPATDSLSRFSAR